MSDALCLTTSILSGLLNSICILVAAYISYHGFYHIFFSKKCRMSQFYIISFCTAILSLPMFAVCSFIMFRFYYCQHSEFYGNMFRLLSTIFYIIMLSFLVTTLAGRLYYTFEGTVYKLHPYVLRFMFANVVALDSLGVLFTVLTIVVFFFGRDVSPIWATVRRMFALFCLSVYLVMSFTMVSLFIRKLYQLILSQARTMRNLEIREDANLNANLNGNAKRNENNDNDLSVQQTRLIGSVSKYTVLAFVAFITSFIWICFIAANTFNENLIAQESYLLMNIIDALCNIFCLYLQFGFASRDYYRLCTFCDQSCKTIWKSQTKNKLDQIRAISLHSRATALSFGQSLSTPKSALKVGSLSPTASSLE